jgi:hypothetical protein
MSTFPIGPYIGGVYAPPHPYTTTACTTGLYCLVSAGLAGGSRCAAVASRPRQPSRRHGLHPQPAAATGAALHGAGNRIHGRGGRISQVGVQGMGVSMECAWVNMAWWALGSAGCTRLQCVCVCVLPDVFSTNRILGFVKLLNFAKCMCRPVDCSLR